MLDKYYEEELRYLYDSGREFARAYPDRARFLNIDAVGDRDPYVERLFEGFAFLAARIREKIDDSFPELTQGLFDLLWPQMLQEVPSLAIIEFRPRQKFLQETRVIARGTEIMTNPVGPESAICRFTTTQDVPVHPLCLAEVQKSTDTKGQATLVFRFELESGVQWSKMRLSPLRLYLHAEQPTAVMLLEYLTTRAVSCSIRIGNASPLSVEPSRAVLPGGLSPGESLLPNDTRTFWGYALLREYFVFPEKFLCVDLCEIDKAEAPAKGASSFTFSITFDRDLPADKPFRAENFRLFCSPAANLFLRDVEPLSVTGMQSEYCIVADASYPASVHTHSVVAVTGIDRLSGQRSAYEPFHSFKNIGRTDLRTFTIRYRTDAGMRRRCYLSVGGAQLAGGKIREENLSIKAWCTNGTLPRDEVREGAITKPGAGFPDYVMVANITRPTLPCAPPREENLHWMLIGHLGSSYASLASADAIKLLLRLYDWSGDEAKARRIAAISQVSSAPVEMTVAGSVIRGVAFSLGMQESEWRDPAEVNLFGRVLLEFLSHYVSINSYVELTITLQPSGAVRRWNSVKGRQWQI